MRNALIYLKPVIVSNSHVYNEFLNKDFIYKYSDYNNINLLSDKINEVINTDIDIIKEKMIIQRSYLEENEYNEKNKLLINICKSLYLNLNII